MVLHIVHVINPSMLHLYLDYTFITVHTRNLFLFRLPVLFMNKWFGALQYRVEGELNASYWYFKVW